MHAGDWAGIILDSYVMRVRVRDAAPILCTIASGRPVRPCILAPIMMESASRED